MLPMSIQCQNCGEYIHKGKKFNGRKEEAKGEEYLGIKVWRFYLKCTTCLAELTFKTDPKRNDYTVENGATRNFEPWRQRNTEEELEKAKKAREEMGDNMKVLENRTEASKREMDLQDVIEEVKELNARAAQLTTEQIIDIHSGAADRWEEAQIEEMAAKAFAHKQSNGGMTNGAGGKSAAAMPTPLSQFAAAGSSSSVVAAPAIPSASSLRLLNRLPDAVDLSAVDYRPAGGAAALDQLEVPDSPNGDSANGAASITSDAAAAARPASAAATNAANSSDAAAAAFAATASSLPAAAPLAGLLLVKKRKSATDGDGKEKKKKSKKDKKEAQQTNNAAQPEAEAAGLGGLLGSYGDDSD